MDQDNRDFIHSWIAQIHASKDESLGNSRGPETDTEQLSWRPHNLSLVTGTKTTITLPRPKQHDLKGWDQPIVSSSSWSATPDRVTSHDFARKDVNLKEECNVNRNGDNKTPVVGDNRFSKQSRRRTHHDRYDGARHKRQRTRKNYETGEERPQRSRTDEREGKFRAQSRSNVMDKFKSTFIHTQKLVVGNCPYPFLGEHATQMAR